MDGQKIVMKQRKDESKEPFSIFYSCKHFSVLISFILSTKLFLSPMK